MASPATDKEIVMAFMDLDQHHFIEGIEVNEETYINYVPVVVDGDYRVGYLLECVDRTLGTVRYLVVVFHHGRKKDGTFDYNVTPYPTGCGTFFHRSSAADPIVVAKWAVAVIYNLFKARDNG